MECPLYSPEGEHRCLRTIEYEDLSQLTDIEEGYAVEYKEVLDKAVRAKLPKVIASFANAGGGWIFIGAKNDGSLVCLDTPRTDYAQVIGQIVRHRIQPIPRFDCRFIKNPQDTSRGVLVIEVQEGVQPPYLANGNVYVRVGSSADEFAEKADSYVLIDLQRKARSFREELDEFCHRTVYFPPRITKPDGTHLYTFPLFDVYLKRLYAPKKGFILFKEFDKTVDTMSRAYESIYAEKCFCQHAHNSLLFRRMMDNCVDNQSPVIELFHDGSIKICVPIAMHQGANHERALEHLSSLKPIRNTKLVQIIDGLTSAGYVMKSCQTVDAYLSLTNRTAADYAIATEFENMQGMMIEFQTEEFDEYAREYGLPFVGTIDERTRPWFVRHDEVPPFTVDELVTVSFFESLGLPFATANKEVSNRTRRVMLGKYADTELDESSEDIKNDYCD